jgi:hypothetical protein
MAKQWQSWAAGLIVLGGASATSAQEIPDAATMADAVGAECVSPITMDMPRAVREEALACATRALADELNRSMPIRLNEITTVVRATARGGELTYHNRVDADRALFTEGYWRPVKDSIARSTCTTEASRKVISFGGSYRYVWVDREDEPMAELVIDHC